MSLQGTLSTLGITEVLEFLANRSSSGQLDISTASGTASYLLVNGTVSAAEYDFVRGAGENPAEATYYVVAEMDGEFFFDDEPVDGAEEGTDVPTLLGDTADIAERWFAVEEGIPSTSHVLRRNSELDASVTIKPEWWKVLEVLGSGKTSTELSTLLELGILDTSSQALDMVNAGLLSVDEPVEGAPAEADVEEVALEEEIAVEDVPVDEFSSDVDTAAAGEVAAEVTETFAADSAVEAPVENAAPEAVAEPVAYEPVEEQAEVAEAAEPIIPTFSNTLPGEEQPVMATEDVIAQAPAPPILEAPEAVASEPVAHVEPAPAESGSALGFTNNLDNSPADDDGWSTNHFYQEPVPAADPVEAAAPAVAEGAPMAFEEVPAPMTFDETPAPMAFEEVPAPMSFDETPAPMAFDAPVAEPAPQPAEQFDSSSLYGLDASFSETPAPDDSGAMANEVMGDLAFLNEDLDAQMPEPMPAPAPEATAPAQASPAQASPVQTSPSPVQTGLVGDADPFGSLSDLVVDDEPEAEEDRGSVLKFLRRD